MTGPTAARIIREIGRRIAEVRRARGWSQSEFAAELGIALQNVQRMEQGRQNLTVRTIVTVARTLGCAPRELWEPPTTRPARRGRPPRPAGPT